MKNLAAAAVLLVLLAPAVAGQQALEREVSSMRVGGNVSINATVINPLPIQDTLTVVFAGPAIERGLVTPFYPNNDGITCEKLRSSCTLQIGPEAENELRILLTGTSMGQDTLTATVNSSTSHLASTDRMEVRVKPFFGRVTVSAPGIQSMQVAVLAVLGALAAAYVSRD